MEPSKQKTCCVLFQVVLLVGFFLADAHAPNKARNVPGDVCAGVCDSLSLLPEHLRHSPKHTEYEALHRIYCCLGGPQWNRQWPITQPVDWENVPNVCSSPTRTLPPSERVTCDSPVFLNYSREDPAYRANWFGVACNEENRVISLDLSSINLAGDVKCIAGSSLTEIQSFNLARNPKLTGDAKELTKRLEGSRALVVFNISHTSLHGDMHQYFPQNWPRLRVFDISNTRCSVYFETVMSLPGNDAHPLCIFKAGYSAMSNQICAGNDGSLSPQPCDLFFKSLSRCPSLRVLDIEHTGVGGAIPESWNPLRELREFIISYTWFTEFENQERTLFDVESSLRTVRMSNLPLVAPFPTRLLDRTNLTVIHLDLCKFTGSMITDLARLPHLTKFSAANCSSLHIDLASLTVPATLTELDISYPWGSNGLYLSQVFGKLANATNALSILRLAGTGVKGRIPDISQFHKLVSLNLDDTYLCGSLDFFTFTPNDALLRLFSAQNTQLCGCIPRWQRATLIDLRGTSLAHNADPAECVCQDEQLGTINFERRGFPKDECEQFDGSGSFKLTLSHRADVRTFRNQNLTCGVTQPLSGDGVLRLPDEYFSMQNCLCDLSNEFYGRQAVCYPCPPWAQCHPNATVTDTSTVQEIGPQNAIQTPILFIPDVFIKLQSSPEAEAAIANITARYPSLLPFITAPGRIAILPEELNSRLVLCKAQVPGSEYSSTCAETGSTRCELVSTERTAQSDPVSLVVCDKNSCNSGMSEDTWCSSCRIGYYWHSHGTCKSCEDSDVASPKIFLIVHGVLLLALALVTARRPDIQVFTFFVIFFETGLLADYNVLELVAVFCLIVHGVFLWLLKIHPPGSAQFQRVSRISKLATEGLLPLSMVFMVSHAISVVADFPALEAGGESLQKAFISLPYPCLLFSLFPNLVSDPRNNILATFSFTLFLLPVLLPVLLLFIRLKHWINLKPPRALAVNDGPDDPEPDDSHNPFSIVQRVCDTIIETSALALMPTAELLYQLAPMADMTTQQIVWASFLLAYVTIGPIVASFILKYHGESRPHIWYTWLIFSGAAGIHFATLTLQDWKPIFTAAFTVIVAICVFHQVKIRPEGEGAKARDDNQYSKLERLRCGMGDVDTESEENAKLSLETWFFIASSLGALQVLISFLPGVDSSGNINFIVQVVAAALYCLRVVVLSIKLFTTVRRNGESCQCGGCCGANEEPQEAYVHMRDV